ncbi:hypothetical protein Dimus_001563 [Dionaea muscipula]
MVVLAGVAGAAVDDDLAGGVKRIRMARCPEPSPLFFKPQNYRHSSRTLTIIFVLSLASAARRRGAITAHHREARRCPSPIIPHHHLTSSVSLTIITNLHRPERDHRHLLTCRRRAREEDVDNLDPSTRRRQRP